MMKTKRNLRRRELLAKGAQTLGLAAVSAAASPAAGQAVPPAHSAASIPMRTLGKTGLKLPILGYGGAALPKAWGNPLSYEIRVKGVRYAFDRGIRYFDTGKLLSYGYIPRGSSSVWSDRMTKLRDECLARAHEMGMGIVAMKVIGGGWLGRRSGYLVPGFDKQRLAQLPGAAIRHVLQDPRVDLLAIGMSLKEHFDANIEMISSGGACTPADRALLAEFSARLYETDFIKKMRIE